MKLHEIKNMVMILAMVMTSMVTRAFTGEVEIDGIRYNISTKEQKADAIGLANVSYSGAITIPSFVEYEGKMCYVNSVGGFSSSQGITSLKICDGIIELKENAFKDCVRLSTIDIPQSILYIGSYAFDNTKWYNDEPDGVVYLHHIVYKYKGEMPQDSEINIKEGTKVIAQGAFVNMSNLKAITFPSTLYVINSAAFMRCSSLQSIQLNNVLLGTAAFRACSNLKEVTLNHVELAQSTNNYDGCFSGCNNIEKVSINGPLAQDWFAGIPSLKTVFLGNDVRELSYRAFNGCVGIEQIEIPNGITTLYGFRDCTGLKEISVPESVKEIGDYTFSGCTNLSKVILPSGLHKIGSYSFSDCKSLKSLIIPNAVDTIGFTIGHTGYTFAGCDNLTTIVLPDHMHDLGRASLGWCSKLKSIIIPEGVSEIQEDLFCYCSNLESICIPSTVTNIKGSPFYGCEELTDIFCYSPTVPTCTSRTFDNAGAQYVTLHVPANAIDSYKVADYWKDFKEIVAIPDYDAKKCSTPVISYVNGQLRFACDTEGAHFVSDITDEDIKCSEENTINLTATYHISVYAIASGYVNSDIANATLCWIDKTPSMEGIANNVSTIRAMPVLIQNNGSTMTITGAEEGTSINIYDTTGKLVGSAKASSMATNVNTSLRCGDIGIVKIGEKAVKVLMK